MVILLSCCRHVTKCDIHRRFLRFYEWNQSTLIILYLATLFRQAAKMWHISYIFWVLLYLTLYSAPNKNVTYIIDSVSGFKSENSQLWSFFNLYAIRHTAEMGLSYIFWFTKWKKSSLVILCFELYTACSKNQTYFAHFF